MELVFIRHGQGYHTLNLPESLQLRDSPLTDQGIKQAISLRETFPLTNKDIIVISPIRRTLQTAFIWSKGMECKKIVNPLVSPRMFPQKTKWSTLPCDKMMDSKLIEKEFPDFTLEGNWSTELWSEGINTISEEGFSILGEKFIEWCKQQNTETIYIVSHDGTITSYRQLLSGQRLSRKDFPEETGWIKIKI
ncbi:histidine phosphatase family protein [Bacillus seohaeanensis]|jgi:broad specificity phosphatase PhoE|uniref:Histidine phosphatase family protein n=1 Tax=Bacillus seohaeanensis TaxID=284580 RepID=A0ABW5RQ89_9BACI